jgi:hypothetical protein
LPSFPLLLLLLLLSRAAVAAASFAAVMLLSRVDRYESNVISLRDARCAVVELLLLL